MAKERTEQINPKMLDHEILPVFAPFQRKMKKTLNWVRKIHSSSPTGTIRSVAEAATYRCPPWNGHIQPGG